MKKISTLVIFCILIFRTEFLLSQNVQRIDSLSKELNKTDNDTLKANYLNEIAWEYKNIEPRKAIELARKALLISEKENFKKGSAIAYNNIGNSYNNISDYEHALNAFDSSLLVWNSIPNFPASRFHKESLSAIYNNKGVVHRNKGDYNKALEFYLDALEIDKELKDKSAEATSYNNIGIIYYYLGDLEKTIYYFEESLALKTELKNYDAIPVSINNIAAIYAAQGKIEKSIQTYEKAIKLYEEQGLKAQKLASLGNIGAIYIQSKRYEEAKVCLDKSLAFAKELEDKVGVVENLINIGLLHSEMNENDKALDYLKESKEQAEKTDSKELFKEIYAAYVSVYKSSNNWEKVYENQLIYEQYKDSTLNESKIKAIAELETKFETEQKEKEIIQLEADKKASELALIKKDTERNTIIGLVAILLLAFTFSYFYWRQKQLANSKTIALNNERINSLLKENKINYANAMIEGQEAERKRLAEDLHDRVGSILSTMKLHLSSSKAGAVEKAKSLLDESVDEVRKISHNLASISLVKFGLVASLHSLSESLVSDDLKVSFIHHGVDERLPSKVAIALYRCVQELINNVLKHSNATKLTIQIQKNGDQINLIVEDNGKGFDTKQDFVGLGIKNLKSRVKSINGKISFDSLPEKGTTVIIDAPIKI